MTVQDTAGGAAFEAGDPQARAEETAPEAAKKPTARERRQNRNGFLALLGGLMSLAFIGALALGAFLYMGAGLLNAEGPLDEETVVTIPEGAGANTIAAILRREGALPDERIAGLVDPAMLFRTAVRTKDASARLRAGEYRVPAGVSVNGLVDLLTSGQAIQHRVTVPEGLTSYQVVQRLANHEVLEGPIPAVPPEGSIRPETYNFSRGATRQEILDKMMADQRDVVARAWASRAPDLPLNSPEELLVLASIVEKETGVGAERAHVASVFVNRLRRGMRLETDPTVIYGIFGGEGKPSGRPIYRSDLQKETPYNTYQIAGLPPGPIANPGEAALMATANPIETDDYFFVADGTGGHVFSKTYDEHLANVAKWRQIERERKAAREAAAAAAGTETAVAEAAPIEGATILQTPPADAAAASSAPAAEFAADDSPVPLPPRRL
ncbi:MAG: endolytic transglycosylase MltG [Pseudomonadota bacterium]